MIAKAIKVALPILAAAMAVFAMVHVALSSKEPKQGVPPIDPPRSPFMHTVAGSGIVEARSENIEVGAAIAGVVVEVTVTEGESVRENQALFRLDDRQLRADLLVRTAELEAAKSELLRLQSQPRKEEIPPAEALVREAQAQAREALARKSQTKTVLERVKQLYHPSQGVQSVTQIEFINAEVADAMADAQLARSEAAVAEAQARLQLLLKGAWEPDLAVARAAVAQAEAQVQKVQTDLERLVIRSPVNGTVLDRDVHPGEFVGAPPGSTLMVIGDLSVLHVRVDIDEQDIPRFEPGAKAEAVLRGRNDLVYPLEFVHVQPYVIPKQSLTGDNRERVDTRVLQVIYALRPPQGAPIYVGQQVDVFIEANTPTLENRPGDSRAKTPVVSGGSLSAALIGGIGSGLATA